MLCSGGIQFRNVLFERSLYLRQRFLRHATVTGGAVHTGMKCLVCHGFPLIPRPQVIDFGRDLRQRLGKLGLILLGLSADNLFTQCAKLFLLLHRIAAFITGHLIVSLT